MKNSQMQQHVQLSSCMLNSLNMACTGVTPCIEGRQVTVVTWGSFDSASVLSVSTHTVLSSQDAVPHTV